MSAAESELECPLIPACCEEDCCGEGTFYDGDRCTQDPCSGGFDGSYSPTHRYGCIVRSCCEDGCCGVGTAYDSSSASCIPLDSPFADMLGAAVAETDSGYVITYPDEDTLEETTVSLVPTDEHVFNNTDPEVFPYCATCPCDECPDNICEENLESGGGRRLRKSVTSCLNTLCVAWMCKEKALGPLPPLPPCPPAQAKPPGPPPAGWVGLGPANIFHLGASHCMRSAEVGALPQAGQQCCYDNTNALITSGLAAGTPDRFNPGNLAGKVLHAERDVLPLAYCSFRTYLDFRPPNPGPPGTPANPVNAIPWWWP